MTRKLIDPDVFIAVERICAPSRKKREWKSTDNYSHRFLTGGLRLYKKLSQAIKHNTNLAGDPPLVVRYRPDDLEPVNITADERVAWHKAQITKWSDRLLELGLTSDEIATICEEQMLAWGQRMQEYEKKETL